MYFPPVSPLYGRNNAIAKLSQACRQIDEAKPAWILIEGPAGIGKTSLVNFVRTTLNLSPTQFGGGKFEQFHRQTPYSALIAALRRLVQNVLNLPPSERAAWQARLREVSANVAPLVDVLPELAFLLDDISMPAPLPPKEAQQRLEAAFASFIGCFARASHPLLIFLDDLQWADVATLRLLKSLGTDHPLGHLMIVGTCRDNELTSLHPLRQALDALQQLGITVSGIQLSPISARDMEEWLCDAYGMMRAAVEAPARWLAQQSEGNPLFAGQLLNTLRERGVLHKDADQHWHWQSDQLQEARLAGNITTFMEDRLRELPLDQQALLSQAACLGTQFSVAELSRIKNDTPENVSALLAQIAEAQLVEPGQNGVWRFAHDRIQQAAYRLMPDPQRLAQHLHIGRLLLATTPEENLDATCFDLVAQFNQAAHLLTQKEHFIVAELNLRAGRRAKASAAFEAALGYLRAGQSMLPEEAWRDRNGLAFELAREGGECAYATGDVALADQLFQTALLLAQNRLDRARVYGSMIMFTLNAGRARDAWQLGSTCLAEFDIHLTIDPAMLESAIIRAEPDIREKLAALSLDYLLDNSAQLTAEEEAVGDLLLRLYVAGYQMGKQTYAYITMRMMEFALQTHHPGVLAFGLMNFAVILISRHNAYAEADRHSQTALKLAESLPDPVLRARIDYVFGSMVSHWTQPIASGLAALERCYEQSSATADKVYIGLALSFQFRAHIMSGEPVPALLQFWENTDPVIQKINSAPIAAMFVMNRQWLRAWQEDTLSPTQFDAADFDTDVFRKQLESFAAKSPFHWFCLLHAILAYMHGKPAEAKAHMAQADTYLDAVAGQLSIPEHHFWRGLILHANGDREALKTAHDMLADWSANCPANFSQRAFLLRAELQRAHGQREAALVSYQAAIQAARDSRHLLVLGLALERLGGYFLELNLPQQAHATLAESVAVFKQWGAPSKVRQLETQAVPAVPGTTAGTANHLQSVMSEIRIDRLLARLLPELARITGAECIAAFIDREGQLMLEAHFPEPDAHASALPLALENASQFPAALIADACKQRRMLTIAEPAVHPVYGYLANWPSRPAAALCLPFERHGRILGAFYLERRRDSWPAEVLDTLESLATQIATSLENALLYANLEQQIGERARAEKIAREGERRWRALLEHAHMAVLSIDLDGIIQYVNPFLQLLSGYSSEELVGKDWTKVLLPPLYQAQPAHQKLLKELHEHGYYNGLTKIAIKSGEVRTVAWSNSLLRDPDGRPIGCISLGSDMTDQIKAERELHRLNAELEVRVAQRTSDLAAANEELDSFAYSISHDLRAPLRSIDGFSQALWEDYRQLFDATANDYLQRVRGAADRMDGMIDAMLKMSRQTRGTLMLEEVDLSAMAREVTEELQIRFPDRLVTTTIQPHMTTRADSRLIRNVLDNLFGNAWKYTADRTGVHIRFDMIEQENECIFCVTDNGPGFDLTHAGKLFTAFQRLHSGKDIEGHGIGLATVQRIIHRHGGRIWAEAEAGKGASFRFTLKEPN
ncbi:MAG: AAA family ATPase [Burkholderiales bacterium]|nr:AAA family ATPase [Burkholderiales bacterium]